MKASDMNLAILSMRKYALTKVFGGQLTSPRM
jgi:hypothetical protein